MDNDDLMKEKECQEIINKKDLYDILGLTKVATEDEIRKSYKKLAIKYHPDKNSAKSAADAFKKISHSFSVLSNKEKKQNYDTFGNEEGMSTQNVRFTHDDVDPFVFGNFNF
jgi:DnaJ-class molecular chaperone